MSVSERLTDVEGSTPKVHFADGQVENLSYAAPSLTLRVGTMINILIAGQRPDQKPVLWSSR